MDRLREVTRIQTKKKETESEGRGGRKTIKGLVSFGIHSCNQETITP